jgi:hypothetical protein
MLIKPPENVKVKRCDISVQMSFRAHAASPIRWRLLRRAP